MLGEANLSTAGASDLEAANRLAREMVYRCGFSSKLGPVSLMDNEEVGPASRSERGLSEIERLSSPLSHPLTDGEWWTAATSPASRVLSA